VANSLHNVAKLYFLRHQYVEAEPLYRRALAILEQSLGPDHPTLAQYLASYAGLLETPNESPRLQP